MHLLSNYPSLISDHYFFIDTAVLSLYDAALLYRACVHVIQYLSGNGNTNTT